MVCGLRRLISLRVAPKEWVKDHVPQVQDGSLGEDDIKRAGKLEEADTGCYEACFSFFRK